MSPYSSFAFFAISAVHAFPQPKHVLFERKPVMQNVLDPDTSHSEGRVAKAIEEQTAKLPSDLFLWLAGGSIATSLGLKMAGRHTDALFVGQWAPTFLILGLYNKLVKVAGSD